MASIIHSDARHCERVARRHASTFSFASYFLPSRKRRGAFAIYAFCKTADDMARSTAADWKAAIRRLQDHRRDLAEALDGRPRGPVFRELRWTVREFEIPRNVMLELVDAMIRNTQPHTFATWDDLLHHCDDMASTIGMMYGSVFGIPGGPRQKEIALGHARTLGIAMQLTSILRDVGEDASLGRCLLPAEELARFSLTREDLVEQPDIAHDPRWHRLLTFEISRARALYENALPGITMLSADAQRCAAACVIGYAAILDALEQIRYDSVSTRASVGSIARLGVLWEAWRFKGRARIA